MNQVCTRSARLTLSGLIFATIIAAGCHSGLRSGSPRPDGSVPPVTPGPDAGASGALELLAGRLGGEGDLDDIGTAAHFRRLYGVAADGAGSLFVTDVSSYVVRQIALDTGTVTTFAGSPGLRGSIDGTGPAARFHAPGGIAVDGAGNLFVADSGNNTIRKIAIATGAVTTFAGSAGNAGNSDGVGAAARFFGPTGVASDGMGSLFISDTNNRTIRRIALATGTVSTVAGSPGAAGSSDGTGSEARFLSPTGIASDGAGHLFVADSNNQLIRSVDVSSGAVSTLAGSALPMAPPGVVPPLGAPSAGGSKDGIGADAQFHGPLGLTLDYAGNLFVADQFNCAIRTIDLASRLVTTLVGDSKRCGAVDGAPGSARFENPVGVAWDRSGALYVADAFNYSIRKVALDTGNVSTLAGSPKHAVVIDGTRSGAGFSKVSAIAGDGEGNVFIADGQVLRKLDIATGVVTSFAGAPDGQTPTSADGMGSAARFSSLDCLAADGVGHLFAADRSAIRTIDLATGAVTTLAGSASESEKNDGIGAAARFGSPGALAYDGAGSLFLSDWYTIRKVDVATGAVTTIAGLSRAGGSRDGIGTNAATSALFSEVHGLTADGAGNLFVADTGNDTIRKIDVATGRVTTFAGAADSAGSADGIAGNARFDSPVSIVFDGKGNLFVGDLNNHTIRKITIANQAVVTVLGAPGRMGVVLGPLPGNLSCPHALAMGPSGALLIGDYCENVILAARF